MTANRKKGILSAALGCILWGICGIAGQFLLVNRDISPAWLTWLRLLSAGVLLLLYAAWRGKGPGRIWRDRRGRLRLLAFGAFGMLWTQYGYFAAIKYSNAPTATVLEYTMPILIMAWACLSEKRLPAGREIFCAFFAIVGTVLIATDGNFGTLIISPKALFWGLVASVACAIYTVVPVSIIRQYGPEAVIGWGMVIAGLLFTPVPLMTPFTGTLDLAAIGAFWFVVLFGTILSFVFYLGATAYITPTETSIIAAVEPLTSIVCAFLLFHQTSGLWQLAGMALIILAVGAVARK